jgi:ferredoxin
MAEERTVRVTVDHGRCVGNRLCTSIAAGVFRPNANGQSEVYNVEGESLEKILKAADNCPTMAIRVTDAATCEELFP